MNDFSSDKAIRCEARVSGPDDPEFCTDEAVFEIDRLCDSSLASCPAHLGPLLMGARNVLWPPRVQLLEPGEHPANALVAGSEKARQHEADFTARLGLPPTTPKAPHTDPMRLAEAVSALGATCPVDGGSSKDVPVLLGALLAAVESALVNSGNGGPDSVDDVLRGYEAASSLVRGVGWATTLHMRFARTAAEVERVLDSEIGYAATGAAHLASSVLRLEMVAGGRSVRKPFGGPVPAKEMYQAAKKLLAEVRSALDREVRQELARAGHRV
ncbi:hypothetical protein [Streptomyces sp. NPDC004267]|uniref:hypothetical protein n=1 Tax=Streptomyces sp. NPDC004267 TaxID=3364694 RepID=UPI0036B78CF8